MVTDYKFDLEDYLSKFKRHLDSVHTLSRDQRLANLYHAFEISPVASAERDEAFQQLKSMLQSTVNGQIDSRTTILDKSGKVVVDDVDEHEEETCSSCHSLRDDVDVMITKLRSAGVILKQTKPTIEIIFDRPAASKQERRYTKVMENVIYRYNKRGWAISVERNMYSKLYDDMPTVGHSKLPIGHPSLPVETYICFTRAINTNRVTLKGEIIIIKSYVKVPKMLLVKLSYNKP
jgi:ArsR family metal-binding transcriptional regulator